MAGPAAVGAAAPAPGASPATSTTRTPPDDGCVNGCETRRSPATTATAVYAVPGRRPSNAARPAPSVFRVPTTAPLASVSVTSWPTTLLPSVSRITRTVALPDGASGAGSERPFICDRSGIPGAPAGAPAGGPDAVAPAALSPATITTRMPPDAGCSNGCDASRSPETTATAV